MYHFTILHEDLVKNSKIKELIRKLQPNSKIQSALSPDQLKEVDQTPTDIKILITESSHLEYLITLQLLNNNTHIIALGGEIPDDIHLPNVVFLEEKFLITGLSSLIDDITKASFAHENYIPISFEYIKAEASYPADIYLKLNKDKYIKIIKKDNPFDINMHKKLLTKQVDFLYIEKENLNIMNDALYERKRQLQLFKTKFKFSEVNAVESLHDYVTDLGFDAKIITMVEDMHKNVQDQFPQKFMQNLFARFKEMEGSFLYNHSYLTSVVTLQVSKKLSWMNPENREKIYLGCILHDLGFKHKEDALKEGFSKSQLKELPKEKQDEIINHPNHFASKLAQIDNIHQDVIKIVKDHHGVHGDESYPKQIYPSEVNLIFALFVLGHEFVLELFKVNFKTEKIEDIKSNINERFNKGAYRKILPEFLATIDEIFLEDKNVA